MSGYAGVDIGTSGVRCVVIEDDGTSRARASRAWSYVTDDTGFPRLDARDAMRAVTDTLAEAASSGPVEAIGVTSQRSGVVFLDDTGRELYVGPNADGRAFIEGLRQEREHGEDIYRIAGRLPAMLYLPARLAWLRASDPDARVAHALSLGDWITYRLTGAAATERTQAAESLVYDVAADAYSDELMRALDVPPEILPDVLAPGAPAGGLGDGFGFAPGTPVVPAGSDTQAALIGVGATSPGDGAIVAGTTMLVERVVTEPASDPDGRTWISPMQVPDRWVDEVHCGEAGALVAWFADLMGTSAEGLAMQAEVGQPGGGGVHVVDPYPSAATNFALTRQAAISFYAPVLALGRPRADIARACFEGIAFGARTALAWLEERHGPPERLFAVGGVTHAVAFGEALAGSAERDVICGSEPDASGRGAAIVAASEHLGGVEAATEAMHDRGRLVGPRASDGYPAHYAAWRARAEAVLATTTMKQAGG